MNASRTTRHQRRGNPLLRERVHDPYRSREKLSETTRCPQCGLQRRGGRWAWPKHRAVGLKTVLCPACRRTNDHYPAGEVVLSGSFVDQHRDEVLRLVHNVADSERNYHPLHRIMETTRRGADTVISTTDIHLPHRIGHALHDAWSGDLKTHYDLEGYFARVTWLRND